MFLIKSEINPLRKTEIEDLAKRAIDHGEWVKTLI